MKIIALALILALPFSALVIAEAAEAPSAVENSWAIKSSMHFSRTGAGAATVNGIVYVIGGSQEYNTSDNGFSYISINSTEAYDPATDTWVEKASMPTARDGLGAAVFQGKMLLWGKKRLKRLLDIN